MPLQQQFVVPFASDQLFLEVSTSPTTLGTSEGRDGVFVFSFFPGTCQDVEHFVPLLRLSARLNIVGRQLCAAENPVKSFFKGDSIKSWGNIGIGYKMMCSKTLVEMNNNNKNTRKLKNFYWTFSPVFHNCHFWWGSWHQKKYILRVWCHVVNWLKTFPILKN